MLRFAAPLLVLSLIVPETAQSVSNPNAKILIHLAPPVTKTACIAAQAKPACASIRTAGNLLPDTYFAYVLATDGASCQGIAGVQFGINYNGATAFGADIYSWTSCATQEVPGAGWPAAGTGIQIGWDPAGACQTAEPGGSGTGVVATVGYFYVAAYTADALRVIQRPVDGLARITDCRGNTTTIYGNGIFPNPSPLGYAAFSASATSPGYSPCGAVVQPPSCVILGSSNLAVGQVSSYAVDASTCDGTATWSITGRGSIQGPTVGSWVDVHADAVGSFTLTASGMGAEGPFSCSRTVQVFEPLPGCSIAGPATVPPGATATYAAPTFSGASYAWTITGNGSITGAADQQLVMVIAGDPGSFHLSLNITMNGETNSCGRTVDVAFAGCTICCFDDVFSGPGIFTFYPGPDTGAEFAWSISGNGTIVGSATNWAVNVAAGPASGGPFTLMVQITTSSSVRVCSKTVNVLEPAPPPPGGNRQAKIMLHMVPPAPMGCDLGSCCTFGATRPCPMLVTKAGLYPSLYYAALLIVDGETDGSPYSGISGVQLGIDYNGATGQGVDIFNWVHCAGAPQSMTGGWPDAGGGNLLLFDPVNGCQKREPAGAGTGVSAQFGYFYLAAYTPDRFSVTVNPADGIAKVIDCAGRVTNIEGGGVHGTPSPLGYVSFSQGAVTPGYNPCDQVIPVENTTWSRIKGLFVEPATKPK